MSGASVLRLLVSTMLIVIAGSYGTPYGDDVIFAVPALSEKGYLDVRIEVSTKGGHSSVPPKHTVRPLHFETHS